MSFCAELLTKSARTYFTGKGAKYVFKKSSRPLYHKLERINLYLHIPFCKNMCPYCPYNKVPYEKAKVRPYINALFNEIRLYHDVFARFEISSIYIGGGTPTLLLDELGDVLEEIKDRFDVRGNICIETSPNDISPDMVKKLKHINIDLVSLGVQSFQDNNLAFIGRHYAASILDGAIARLLQGGFKSVNIDLMFAIPGQGDEGLKHDLRRAVELNVPQITTYPLFTFPYTSVGRYLRLKNVRMPKLSQRRKAYYYIHNYLNDNGYKRVSVWGFKKGEIPRYSSVTRDNYIGLGAGAGSHMQDGFYLNTFAVAEYISQCNAHEFPTALRMEFTRSMQDYFWLYWRFYDTYINKEELVKRFGKEDKRVRGLLNTFKVLGLVKENSGAWELTLQGAFWIHLAQNYFSLNYINKVWNIAMAEPFPKAIFL